MGREIGRILRVVELFVGEVGNEIDRERVKRMRIKRASVTIPACFLYAHCCARWIALGVVGKAHV